MKKGAYFKQVTGLGDLFLEHRFMEFEREPILFTCVDAKGNTFLCLCTEIRYKQKWIVLKCDSTTLSSLIERKMELGFLLE